MQPRQSFESAPNITTCKTKNKTKNKDKAIEEMCSNIGSMAQSVEAMVPKLGGLFEVLSTVDKEISKLQGKLMEELMKVNALNEDQIIDATIMLASKHDLLRVFFSMPDNLKRGYVLKMLYRGV